ncbi:MAG: alpha-amylase/4-alpha-glucanotransferase domain-containing protein [Candidatus Omnitrophota bacterium]
MGRGTIDLLMAIHSHQPEGNFDWVFAEAYEKSYLPFLESLYRRPRLKMSLHYSGCLLDWMADKHPEFIGMLKEMVGRGQVEMLGGGYYEPILTLIPERDILGQVKLMNEKLREFTGKPAAGVWLTERVWEPTLIKPLAKAGIKYAIVDDWHFSYVGQKPDDTTGYYVTEDDGEKLFIFPGSEKLRYLMPFKLPHETVDYMRGQKDKGVASKIFADDGEKFGVWPGTHKWVYEEKWLENFFNALESESPWLKTTMFSDYIRDNGPTGRIYLTCASYREMMEWSGGYFKNFLVKYPEANSMQKKMQFVSGLVAEAKPSASRKALEYIYKSQCNCAYWHGVFGGLYLNHLRSAVYSNIIKAQKELDKAAHKKADWVEVVETDFDCDSYDEVLISNSKIELDISPHNGGSIFELDFKPLALNLTNTLARRREPYHDKALEKAKAAGAQGNKSDGIDSIHDVSRAKDAELVADLSYDWYRRVSLIDHFLKEGTTVKDFAASRYGESGDFVDGEYKYSARNAKPGAGAARLEMSRDGNYYGADGAASPVRIVKTISVKPNKAGFDVEYTVTNTGSKELAPRFGIEFSYSLKDPHLNKVGEAGGIKNICVNDQWYGVKVDLEFSEEASLWYFPIETVSDSEQGLERTYQEVALLFHWGLRLAPGGSWKVKFSKNIKIEE